jgi:hypothetical protein
MEKNAMKTLRLILPVLLLASSAFAQDVSYNFDSTADFSKYKTYRWEKHPQSTDINEITLNQLSEAFDAELARKGLVKTGSGKPDLVIVYQAAVKQEKEVNSYTTGWGYGAGWGGGYYGGGMGGSSSTQTIVSTISIGSLNLDIYDANKKNLIWRGIASKTLDVKAKPEKQSKNIAKAAAKLLKNYPPKKK